MWVVDIIWMRVIVPVSYENVYDSGLISARASYFILSTALLCI